MFGHSCLSVVWHEGIFGDRSLTAIAHNGQQLTIAGELDPPLANWQKGECTWSAATQFLQQGAATNKWNDFDKYLLAHCDNILAADVLDWWHNNQYNWWWLLSHAAREADFASAP